VTNHTKQKNSKVTFSQTIKEVMKTMAISQEDKLPWDDEPTTEEDLRDIAEAQQSIARGEGIKLKDVIDDLLN
jgi:hypothetical protein